jgi:hypothetical protein
LGTQISAQALLGQEFNYTDGFILFMMLQSGALQEKWVPKLELGNQK